MAENYHFEYGGADFNIMTETGDAPTTTQPPNLRVIEGTWQTWRLEVDPDVPGLEGLQLLKSVSSTGVEHPNGNLTTAESAGDGHLLMISELGYLYKIPVGYGVVSRISTTEEWQQQLAMWGGGS